MSAAFNKLILCPMLIGRAPYLASFQPLLETAASGQRQAVLLSGEAGIGKSRLAEEIRRASITRGFLTLYGHCSPADRATPYAPILDMLRTQFADQRTGSEEARENAPLRALRQLLPGIFFFAADETVPLDLAPEAHKQQLFTALIAFFAASMAKQPLLLLFEDLHWSDAASLDFLLYLIRWSAAQPLFLILTYRTDEINAGLQHWLAEIDRERSAQEFPLTLLTRDDVAEMMRAIFDQPMPTDVLETVYRLTEGNPFFVEEILKLLVISGDLVYKAQRWQYQPSGDSPHIPRSMQDTLRQRAAALSPTSQQVLNTAAILGRRFSFTILQALTGLDEPSLVAVLKELIAAQLMVSVSAEDFAFRHALTREAVYSALLVRERMVLHRSAAETIELMISGSTTVYLDELAYHYRVAEVWDKALIYARQAGERAHQLYAPHAAIEQFSRALDAAHHLSALPDASLYRLRALDYQMIGAFDLAKADHEAALGIARTTRSFRAEGQALLDLGALWAERDYAQTRVYYQQALDLAKVAEDNSIISQSLNRLGNWYINAEQPRQALEYHQQALTLFQEGEDTHGVAETYDLLGLDCFLQGDLYHGLHYFEQAAVAFRQLDDRQGLASCLANQVIARGIFASDFVVAVPLINMNEALARGEEALTIARETDQRAAEAYALCTLANCLGAHGDYALAFELAREGLQIARSIEHRQWITFGHWTLGKIYLDVMAAASAQQHFEQALALAQEINSLYWLHTTTGLLGRVYTLQNEFVRAETLLHTTQVLQTTPQTYGQRLIWSAGVQLTLAQGKVEEAQRLVEQLVETASNISPEHLSPALLLVYGEVLSRVQQETEAESVLQTALTLTEKLDLPPLLWRVQLSLGKLFLTRHRHDDARQMLTAAQQIAQELAVHLPDDTLREGYRSVVTAQFPRTRPVTPRRAAKIAFGGLTEREREVALLIVQGMSNPEIAGHLTVGKRTVEAHVSSILSKLGLTSRTQIALWVREKELDH